MPAARQRLRFSSKASAPDLVLSLAATAVTLGELVIYQQVGVSCTPSGSRLVAVMAFLLTVSCVRAVRSWLR